MVSPNILWVRHCQLDQSYCNNVYNSDKDKNTGIKFTLELALTAETQNGGGLKFFGNFIFLFIFDRLFLRKLF